MPKFGDTKMSGKRPYTYGELRAAKVGGGTVSIGKWFMVDSGAQISVVDASNIAALKAAGGVVAPGVGAGSTGASGAGGGVLGSAYGITMVFSVGGQARKCDLKVAVNTGKTYSIIGADQQANTNATMPGPGGYSCGGNIFTGVVNDPFAADTHDNWKNN